MLCCSEASEYCKVYNILKKWSHQRRTISGDGLLRADAESYWAGAVPTEVLPQTSFYAGDL